MAFKIPDNTRYIGTSGNYGVIGYPVPETGGPDAAVFRYFDPVPVGIPALYGLLGRRLTFTRLDMTGVSSIDVNMMLSTPSNPLGAVEYTEMNPGTITGVPRIRVFGDPRDSTFLQPTLPVPAETAFDVRMRWAKIQYTIEDGSNTAITANGTVINTHALVAYNPPANPTPNLSPTSPLRTFSPYTIPVPASLQKNNVTVHIYQEVYRSPPAYPVPGSPSGPFVGIPYDHVYLGPPAVPVGFPFPSTVSNFLRTGYGWAVKSVNLGANNGGVYTFKKTKTYGDPTTTSGIYLPQAAPGALDIPETAHIADNAILFTGYPNSRSTANGFNDTRAISISSGFKSFDGTSANVTTLTVSDKIAFTNTSVRINSFNALNSLDFQSVAQQMPFRGTTGYVGRTFMRSVSSTLKHVWTTKFSYASENWQVIRAQNATPAVTRPLAVNTFPANGTRLTLTNWVPSSGSAALATVTTTTAGGNYYPSVMPWASADNSGIYRPAIMSSATVELYGHSTSYGYHASFSSAFGGEPVPIITPIYSPLYPAPQIPYFGPLPAANRIRGSIIRFPFANFTDLNEIGDGGSTAYMRSTWSGPSNMYFYGGAGQPAATSANWWGNGFAATSLTTSFKFPFASLNLVTPAILTLTATGAGAQMDQASAVTDHAGAWVIGGRYLQATSPTTLDWSPQIGTQAPGAPADSIVVGGQSGRAADPISFTGAYTGFTESAVRNVQRFPWASETFTSVGTIGARVPGTPLYVYNVRSAGSETAAYFTGIFYVPGAPLVFDTATWGKFPFSATTAVAGTFGISPVITTTQGAYTGDDVGISNSQSPENSYTYSYKFPFSSESQVGIITELSMRNIENLKGYPNKIVPEAINGAMNF